MIERPEANNLNRGAALRKAIAEVGKPLGVEVGGVIVSVCALLANKADAFHDFANGDNLGGAIRIIAGLGEGGASLWASFNGAKALAPKAVSAIRSALHAEQQARTLEKESEPDPDAASRPTQGYERCGPRLLGEEVAEVPARGDEGLECFMGPVSFGMPQAEDVHEAREKPEPPAEARGRPSRTLRVLSFAERRLIPKKKDETITVHYE
jgi:hypothetical protein